MRPTSAGLSPNTSRVIRRRGFRVGVVRNRNRAPLGLLRSGSLGAFHPQSDRRDCGQVELCQWAGHLLGGKVLSDRCFGPAKAATAFSKREPLLGSPWDPVQPANSAWDWPANSRRLLR